MTHSRPWRACGDDLHVRVKDTLVQPQSEREAVLTGREPPQGNGDDLREPQGVRVPCRRCQLPSGLFLKPCQQFTNNISKPRLHEDAVFVENCVPP